MQYRYATDQHGVVVDVLSLDRGRGAPMPVFACAGCSGTVVPVLGATRERHFRHKATGDRTCSKETYLHRLAKTLVAESFRAAMNEERPYWLILEAQQVCRHWEKQFGFTCERESGMRRVDLTRYFDTARIEAGVEGFVADVLFSSSRTGDRLLAEIVVSHECSPEKVASGLRILEIGVHEEVDLTLLPTGIDTRRYWYRKHNFKPQKPLEASCRGRCNRNIAAFHVFESGKSFIKVGTPREIAAVMRAEKTVHSHIIGNAEHGIITPHLAAGSGYHLEAMKALSAGAPIKCCTFCRYAGSRTYEKPVFCKIKRSEVGVNRAATCEAYRPSGRTEF
ncbi:hypothetical protein GGQ97_001578 [Sphingomonas kaistensis]|uniref:Competence protein CoiA-like family protein n=1 Tax=Sphingomonas kaistensis TaxID=298708 RepID=A0A7X5Y8D9_9SPHN|nr:hypothetical protein [Sphingomonas kaistensis]NJC05785.1 hypothetical protein [Sphingomonas kaistensis]